MKTSARFAATGLLLFLFASCNTVAQDNPYAERIRTTDPQSPNDELKSLQLADGLIATPFAAEPDIQKPLNMAFDADGRLWVSSTIEYPYAAEEGKGGDSVRILEDTDGDGRADKVTVFADNLNIAMGLYPYRNGAVVFSIPNIYYLEDTDGDDVADRREVLYGPFDCSRDTHGMNSSFRRGYDGWLYCCHGHANRSVVKGKDGHTITMDHGNTYRIRLDGSRIEHYGHGQVNPFGMTIDQNGDIFTSDCHSKPVTMLMRDGYSPSFGRPHDGLGFVPAVMNHQHGSTAIDGVCQYQGSGFPDEYRENLFVGNVMTGRVHRNSIQRFGSTVALQEEPDIVVSSDPWFRPVDIQYGPDDAIYVADFYNRIIGHYEVPLDHPGRDRHRGRIWRITHQNVDPAAPRPPKLRNASKAELIGALDHADKPTRQHAIDQLADRIGETAVPDLTVALAEATDRSRPGILWVLSRLNGLSAEQLLAASQSSADRTRLHTMKIASETATDSAVLQAIQSGLHDEAPLVQRAAADAASRHPDAVLARSVLDQLSLVPAEDVHLRHLLRIALRNQLRSTSIVNSLVASALEASDWMAIADVLPGLRGNNVVPLTLALIDSGVVDPLTARDSIRQAATESTADQLQKLVGAAIQLAKATDNIDDAVAIRNSMSAGFARNAIAIPEPFRRWSAELSGQLLSETDPSVVDWGLYAFGKEEPRVWGYEKRSFAEDHAKVEDALSSMFSGESNISVLRSAAFKLPERLELRIHGHIGDPKLPPDRRNRVVLRDLESGQVLAGQVAPASDPGHLVHWELPTSAGRQVYLDVECGVRQPAYAWIALSSVNPPVLSIRHFDGGLTATRLNAACDILEEELQNSGRLSQVPRERLQQFLLARQLDGATRAKIAQLLLAVSERSWLQPVGELLKYATLECAAEKQIIQACVSRTSDAEATRVLVREVFRTLDADLRQQLASNMAGDSTAASLLLTLMDEGVPSANLLRDERLRQQLAAHSDKHRQQADALVASLPEVADVSVKLSGEVLSIIRNSEGSASAGRTVFDKNCRACHRRAGVGGQAGPQLDGMASRGLTRTVEDILKPNMNVDVSFRTTVVVMSDGRTKSGIVRQGADRDLQVIDANGRTETIRADDVDELIAQRLSLMPANFSTLLKAQELADLITWLVTEPPR
jgi:putative heme-binding domain-containing protein